MAPPKVKVEVTHRYTDPKWPDMTRRGLQMVAQLREMGAPKAFVNALEARWQRPARALCIPLRNHQ